MESIRLVSLNIQTRISMSIAFVMVDELIGGAISYLLLEHSGLLIHIPINATTMYTMP
jgi:hypothetical protein